MAHNKSGSMKLSYPTRAWSIWLLSALFMFYKYALEVSPSVMTNTLMRTFQINGVELGNLAACYFYAYLILQIPAGLLLDRFGPRKTTTIAIALCALGSLAFANADSLFMAGIGRFMTGAGAAFAAVNALKLIANWFPFKQFAFMTGLMMSIAMLGAVGGQAPLEKFIQIFEWRYAMEMIGIAGLILSVLFWFIVKDKAPDHKKEKHIASTKIPLIKSLKQVIKNPQSWWLSAYSGFAFAPIMVFGGLWGASFLSEAYVVSRSVAAQAVSLIFIGFAVGAPVLGWFSDWIGRRKPVMFWGPFLSLLTLSLVIYSPGASLSFLMLLLFLCGFFISGFLVSFTMIREISTPMLAATAIGFMNAFNALFGAVSDPLTGKILDVSWSGKMIDGARIFSVYSYKIAFLILPILLILSLFMLLKIKETHCKSSIPSSLP